MKLADLFRKKIELPPSEIPPDVLRRAQEIMLEILLVVHEICERHNIGYWLDSGTLLGAVRHGGFIPWDDDLDICMKIEDYWRFLEIAQDELPEGMFLQTRGRDRGYKRYFAKVRSNKGRITEGYEQIKLLRGSKLSYNRGIYIDIFPCITVPKDRLWFYHLVLKASNRARKILDLYYVVEPTYRFADWLVHSGWEGEDLLVVRSVRYVEPFFAIPLDAVFPLRKIAFEGKELLGPSDPDRYLRIMYGDYMRIPPPEERMVHAYKIEVFNT